MNIEGEGHDIIYGSLTEVAGVASTARARAAREL